MERQGRLESPKMRLLTKIKKRFDALRLIKDSKGIEDKFRILICFFIILLPRRIFYKILNSTINNVIRGTVIRRGNHHYCFLSLDCFHQTSDTFEKEIKHWFKIPKGGVFLDVGANIGIYTVQMSEKVGDEGLVISFEPCIDAIQCLLKTIEVNGLRNVLAFPYALWNEDAKKTLYLKIHEGTNSLVEPWDSYSSQTVIARAFDSIGLNLDRIDLVKIDVEGAEKEVLMGMKESLIKYSPNIILEVRNDNLFWIEGFMSKLGYEIKETWKAEVNYVYLLYERVVQ